MTKMVKQKLYSLRRLVSIAILTLCGGAFGEAQEVRTREVNTAVGTILIETFASGLARPWSLAFLPSGELLVSEEDNGQIRKVSSTGAVSPPITGFPPVASKGHGGLFGIEVDPEFDENQQIFFAYSEPGRNNLAGLAVAKARLAGSKISDLEVIFRQTPMSTVDLGNYGGQLLFAPDGMLLVTAGDRFRPELIQDRSNTFGTLVRIDRKGSPAPDNPFVGQQGTDPRIWSYGHRNMEGVSIHPDTGQIWVHEFGPRGGDELNIALAGRNYGWPLVSWGRNYNGVDIPDPPSRPDLEQSIFHWFPVISPSGMTFYHDGVIPQWDGNLLIGGLSSTDLIRLTLRGDRVISDERINLGARIRDVAQGPDGAIYLLTDQAKGEVLRLTLKSPHAIPATPGSSP